MDALAGPEPTVYVSLPENDPELAKAAKRGGTDGLKVHLNVSHRASGNAFGSIDEEEDAIREIDDLGLPLGVVPGQDIETIAETLPLLSDLPVDFADGYAHHLPTNFAELAEFPMWGAPNSEYSWDEIEALTQHPFSAIELSVQPKEKYGDPVSARDAATYIELESRISQPTVLPSQLAVTPADANYLASHGVNNFLLGTVVTGDEEDSIEQTVSEFVDVLG